MTTAFFLVASTLLAILQTTWLANVTVGGGRPDLVLIVLTLSAHTQGVQRGQISGFLVGLVEDVMSLSPMGFHAVIRLSHSAVVGLTRGAVQKHPVLTPVLLVSIAWAVKHLTALLVSRITGVEGIAGRLFTTSTAVEFLLTIVAAPIVFVITERLRRRFDHGRRVA